MNNETRPYLNTLVSSTMKELDFLYTGFGIGLIKYTKG